VAPAKQALKRGQKPYVGLMTYRYDRRLTAGGLWEVYDTNSGETAVVEGNPLTELTFAEADGALKLLRSGEMVADLISDAAKTKH
jgi:hypothetical protein